jgi:hypothetical protein
MDFEAQNIHPGFNLIESTSTISAHQIVYRTTGYQTLRPLHLPQPC